jgi:hypothetical protein
LQSRGQDEGEGERTGQDDADDAEKTSQAITKPDSDPIRDRRRDQVSVRRIGRTSRSDSRSK